MSTAINSQPAERNTEKTTSSANPQFPKLDENDLYPLVNEYAASDTLILLLAIRFLNAIFVGTFFQPDEYFQSLEPAWQMAFGPESGAWITWEWQYQLRSSLHPALFAGAYALVGKALPDFFPEFRAMFLSVLPNIVQGLIAAAGDYYTWRLAERIHGKGSDIAWTCLLMSMFSPWQWFCSTRTFSNSLETTLTIVALNFWPWELAGGDEAPKSANPHSPAESIFRTSKSVARLRVSFLAAALACVLRPTNLLLWLAAVPFTLFPSLLGNSISSRIKTSDYIILMRELFLCGSAVLAISSISDRYYFGEWTFPPYHLLNFNISQDLAVFYGSMPFHYYLSQGLPLLLTTYLPFAIYSIIKPQPSETAKATNIRFILSTTIISTLTVLSLIAHKEVRFIYPLLPLLHILIAPNLHAFFNTTETTTKMVGDFPATPVTTTSPATRRDYIKTALLLLNMGIAYYVTRVHQAGVISVMPYLRSEFERLAFEPQPGLFTDESDPVADALRLQQWKDEGFSTNDTLVGFLMPCHSTPWRSALVYPELKAWALGCEPPLHTQPGSEERKNYVDEADRFYANPSKFLTEEVDTREKPWPRYIAGFEGLEKVLREWYEGESTSPMPGFVMREKWRGKNSHWHDDKRRTGDVVVWEFVDGSMVT